MLVVLLRRYLPVQVACQLVAVVGAVVAQGRVQLWWLGPLAVLAASGVPRGALSRSLLWQNAVPLLLALVVALGVGSGLSVLLLRIISQPVLLDWPGIAVLSGASALMVVVVTVLSLPSLRRATGALGLRSE